MGACGAVQNPGAHDGVLHCERDDDPDSEKGVSKGHAMQVALDVAPAVPL